MRRYSFIQKFVFSADNGDEDEEEEEEGEEKHKEEEEEEEEEEDEEEEEEPVWTQRRWRSQRRGRIMSTR
jgi:hypothetical protein